MRVAHMQNRFTSESPDNLARLALDAIPTEKIRVLNWALSSLLRPVFATFLKLKNHVTELYRKAMLTHYHPCNVRQRGTLAKENATSATFVFSVYQASRSCHPVALIHQRRQCTVSGALLDRATNM